MGFLTAEGSNRFREQGLHMTSRNHQECETPPTRGLSEIPFQNCSDEVGHCGRCPQECLLDLVRLACMITKASQERPVSFITPDIVWMIWMGGWEFEGLVGAVEKGNSAEC